MERIEGGTKSDIRCMRGYCHDLLRNREVEVVEGIRAEWLTMALSE